MCQSYFCFFFSCAWVCFCSLKKKLQREQCGSSYPFFLCYPCVFFFNSCVMSPNVSKAAVRLGRLREVVDSVQVQPGTQPLFGPYVFLALYPFLFLCTHVLCHQLYHREQCERLLTVCRYNPARNLLMCYPCRCIWSCFFFSPWGCFSPPDNFELLFT